MNDINWYMNKSSRDNKLYEALGKSDSAQQF